MFWIACATLLSLIASVFAALLVYRKLRQARIASTLKIESAQGIVEERFVSIGGIDQWISIRGQHHSNPVLLVIHGGPGSCYSIFTPHLRGWEKHFTVVQWDQRGAGKTFARLGSRGSGEISLKQLTSDGISVAEYLRTRLHKERLFLLASSMGSTFGMQIARTRPDMFDAYIGTDQNVGMVRGRDENHREVLDRLRTRGLTKGVRALERIGAYPALWTRDDYTRRCAVDHEIRSTRISSHYRAAQKRCLVFAGMETSRHPRLCCGHAILARAVAAGNRAVRRLGAGNSL